MVVYMGIEGFYFGGGGTLFGNFPKNLLRKLRKMHYFSRFFKKFNKPSVNFLRVWRKNTIVGHFEKIFEHFHKKIVKND